jgi:hypothetical protein
MKNEGGDQRLRSSPDVKTLVGGIAGAHRERESRRPKSKLLIRMSGSGGKKTEKTHRTNGLGGQDVNCSSDEQIGPIKERENPPDKRTWRPQGQPLIG